MYVYGAFCGIAGMSVGIGFVLLVLALSDVSIFSVYGFRGSIVALYCAIMIVMLVIATKYNAKFKELSELVRHN